MAVFDYQRIKILARPTYTGAPAASTPTAFPLPGEARIGDTAHIGIGVRSATATITGPTGWTQLYTGQQGAALTVSIFRRVLDGTGNDSATWQTSASALPAAVLGLVTRDVDQATPEDVIVASTAIATGVIESVNPSSYGTTAAPLNIGGGTSTVTAGTLIAIFQFDVNNAGVLAATRNWTAATDDTSPALSVLQVTQGNGTVGIGATLVLERRPLAGPVNQHAMTFDDGSATRNTQAALVALRPRLA